MKSYLGRQLTHEWVIYKAEIFLDVFYVLTQHTRGRLLFFKKKKTHFNQNTNLTFTHKILNTNVYKEY